MTNRPRGASGSSNPYIAAASGLRQRMYLADFVGCSLPRFGSIATFDRGLLGTALGRVQQRGPWPLDQRQRVAQAFVVAGLAGQVRECAGSARGHEPQPACLGSDAEQVGRRKLIFNTLLLCLVQARRQDLLV